MSLLVPDSGLLFWMLLSFGVVFFVLARYGFPIITRMVDERKAYIDHSLKVADEANARYARLSDDCEAMLDRANKEQARILRDAMHERDKMIAEARKQAEAAVSQLMEQSRRQLQIEKEEAIRDIRRQVAELSVDIAEKVIRRNLSKEDEQMALIDRMLDEMLTKSQNN